jgi:bifunctional DNA-binding transcriptional regulator/antitoxin component of YhaV-PrlF toxin-antitoxin module
VFCLPLTRTVEFRAVLQRGNRVQVPKLVRWEFKLEPSQVLRIRVGRVSVYGRSEYFFGRMSKDGRITVPKLTVDLLEAMFEGESLVGKVLEVQLAPSGSAGS